MFFKKNPKHTFIKTENRNLGLMFQSYALWPHMTVFKNIVFGLEMQKKSLDEKEKRYLELEKLLLADGHNSVASAVGSKRNDWL